VNYYFITGTSRGIGKALAEAILEKEEVKVVGLSRTNTLSHSDFRFVEMDLANMDDVNFWKFPDFKSADKIILVNNAGIVGQVKHTGGIDNDAFARLYAINLTAPCILINNFLKTYGQKNVPLVIMNISSGAGKNPIDGWGPYCASKAALDMFSRVVAEELAISGKKHIHIFSVAPGIVDTAMQDEIRRASVEDFSRIQQFTEYKTSGQLLQPDLIARKLISILDLPEKFPETVFSVKDI
jgi:benzil reductase ((S)-benzoin forming)